MTCHCKAAHFVASWWGSTAVAGPSNHSDPAHVIFKLVKYPWWPLNLDQNGHTILRYQVCVFDSMFMSQIQFHLMYNAPLIHLFHPILHLGQCMRLFSNDVFQVMFFFTQGQFWPSGIVVACICLFVHFSVCPSVHVSITSLSIQELVTH